MFTGIVELLAPVVSIEELDKTHSGGGGFSITIGNCCSILDDCHIGDSISVNGTCLTVTEFDISSLGGYFKVGVAPETLKKTNLGSLIVSDKVNCERAMAAHTRFGGHFVQGHVDTTAVIQSVVPTGNALTLTLRLQYRPETLPLPSELSPYLIPKGYVTLDGASLTLIQVSPPTGGSIDSNESQKNVTVIDKLSETVEFSVMLIKHTQEVIGLSRKQPGDTVNVELDMVGKYVHRAVMGSLAQHAQPLSDSATAPGSVDAARSLVGEVSSGQAIERMVESIVRRVLNEQKQA